MIREALLVALVLLGALALAVWVTGRLHRAHVRERAVLAERAARAALEAANLHAPVTAKLEAEIAALHVLVRDLHRRHTDGHNAPLPSAPMELPRPARAPFFPPSEDSVDEPTRVLERPCGS